MTSLAAIECLADFRGPHLATGRYEVGNPNLDNETHRNLKSASFCKNSALIRPEPFNGYEQIVLFNDRVLLVELFFSSRLVALINVVI